MIRVLFVFPDLAGGGAERAVLNVTRHLDKKRFRSTIFLFHNVVDYAQEIPADVSIYWGGSQHSRLRNNGHRILSRFFRCAARSDVIVGGYELYPTYFAYLAARLCGKPVIGWLHISMEMRLGRAPSWHRHMVRFVYPRLDRIVAVSQGAAKSLFAITKTPAARLQVIHPFLDPLVFSVAGGNLEQSPLPAFQGATLVAVGRLEYQKGFDILIRAYSRLKGVGTPHRLVIIGEGPMRSELRHLATELGVSDNVIMPGFLADPFSVVKEADVYVMSSRFEGFPIVLVEALALGVPIVATNCPSGPGEILDGGRYGLLVAPEDESGLARAIERALGDRDLRGKLQSDSLLRASAFSPEKIMPQWEGLFAGVCS